VVYRSPTTETATLAVAYIRDDGEVRTQSKTLTATENNDPLDQERVTFESLEMTDAFVVDVRLYLSYGAAWSGAIPAAIDSVWIPYTLQREVAA
jgi:hypothetical protein